MTTNERMTCIVTAFTKIDGIFFQQMGKCQHDEAGHEVYPGETNFTSSEAILRRVISTIVICMNTT